MLVEEKYLNKIIERNENYKLNLTKIDIEEIYLECNKVGFLLLEKDSFNTALS